MTDPNAHNAFLTVFEFPEELWVPGASYLLSFSDYLAYRGFVSTYSLRQSTEMTVALQISIDPPDADATRALVPMLKDFLALVDAAETALPQETDGCAGAGAVRKAVQQLHADLLRKGWTAKVDLARYIVRQTALAHPSEEDRRYAHTHAEMDHRKPN